MQECRASVLEEMYYYEPSLQECEDGANTILNMSCAELYDIGVNP